MPPSGDRGCPRLGVSKVAVLDCSHDWPRQPDQIAREGREASLHAHRLHASRRAHRGWLEPLHRHAPPHIRAGHARSAPAQAFAARRESHSGRMNESRKPSLTAIDGGRIDIERALVRHLFDPHADKREGDRLAESLKARINRTSLTLVSPATLRRSDEEQA